VNEKPDLGNVGHRIKIYAMLTAAFQILLGTGVFSTMWGRGPLVLLFLIPMVNIAYPWLMQNAIRVQLWPAAIVVGTLFMFSVIFVIGEITYLLKNFWKPKEGVKS
jgi:hypothetical protein